MTFYSDKINTKINITIKIDKFLMIVIKMDDGFMAKCARLFTQFLLIVWLSFMKENVTILSEHIEIFFAHVHLMDETSFWHKWTRWHSFARWTIERLSNAIR